MRQNKTQSFTGFDWKPVSVLAIIAGLLYSSWPLGGVLNPTVARSGMASQLEAAGQPYNWVFIGGDIASGVLTLAICYWLWQRFKPAARNRWTSVILLGVVVFAAGTVLGAVLPLSCDPVARYCPALPHNPVALGHGIASVLSCIGLSTSVALVWWPNRRQALITLAALFYAVFGIITAVQLFIVNPPNLVQHVYIILCSLWVALLPYGLYRGLAVEKTS